MKKIFYLFILVTFFACSSDDPISEAVIETVENVITDLAATGSVSQQTPVEAKKTIYGKWNFPNSGKTSTLSKSRSCAFDFIEFTDESYIMALILEGEKITAFGSYVMNEDSSGNVSSVSLNFNLGTSEITIATLTNIVVVQNGENLSATFTVDLSIPDDASFAACNSIEGDYNNVGKEEPMEASTNAIEGSNHEILVNNTWTLVSIVEDGEDVTSEAFEDFCIDENASYESGQDVFIDGCSPPTSLVLSISAFGSYSLVYTGGSQGTLVQVDPWNWTDDSQTAMIVGEDEDLITIVSLSNTSAVFSSSYNDEDSSGNIVSTTDIITFSSPSN